MKRKPILKVSAQSEINTAELWVKMKLTYPRAWESDNGKLGEEGFKLWRNALARFSNTTIMRALDKAVSGEKYLDWPPRLPAFLAICKSVVPKAYHDRKKTLPKPPVSHKKALEYTRDIKKHYVKLS